MDKNKVITEADELAAKQKANKDIRHNEIEDLRHVLSTPQGIRVIKRFFEFAGLYRNPMTGNSTTFFNCGMQSVAQRCFDEVCQAATKEQVFNIIMRDNDV
jgi:hypothetical protein